MTIKRRLAISNVFMNLVPIAITLLVAVGCIGFIWFKIAHGTGLGFEDSETFYQASSGILDLAESALHAEDRNEQTESLRTLSSFLDRGAMSLRVTANGREIYRYGKAGDPRLEEAALAIGGEGTVSSASDSLRVRPLDAGGEHYIIYLYGTQTELSYSSLRTAAAITGGILILTIILSIVFTDHFLTRFIFRHIEQPLELLVDGVHQISEGNLGYRLSYEGKDEFSSVCEDFNYMAGRLKESVERSRREEESRKELMAGISHDLRSPLTSIQAYVEGLLDGVASTPEAQRRYLTTVKTRAEELEGMVERILAYSKMEIEDTSRDERPIRLDDFLRTEIKGMAADYEGRGLDISLQTQPVTVRADAAELRQIITNLADNSLKYKIGDRASLAVRLEDVGDSCVLSFTDNGPGVPEEVLTRIFDEFYRVDSSRSDRTKGSGLGLSIVKKAAQRMGGSVTAENVKNGGLSIALKIPKGGRANA